MNNVQSMPDNMYKPAKYNKVILISSLSNRNNKFEFDLAQSSLMRPATIENVQLAFNEKKETLLILVYT